MIVICEEERSGYKRLMQEKVQGIKTERQRCEREQDEKFITSSIISED